MNYFVIISGSALGAMLRLGVVNIVHRHSDRFPWGTLLVNVTGAFAIGLLSGLALRAPEWLGGPTWQLLVPGLLGSYTTVSSFSAQTLALVRESRLHDALLNVAGSVGLCLLLVWAGFMLGGALWP